MSVWKSDETLLIFNSLLGVSSGDETLHLIFGILLLTTESEGRGRSFHRFRGRR